MAATQQGSTTIQSKIWKNISFSSCKLQCFEFQQAHALQGLFNLYALAKQMVPCDPFARKREGKLCSAVH